MMKLSVQHLLRNCSRSLGTHQNRLYDRKTGEELRSILLTDYALTATFSLDSKYVLTGSDKGPVRLWNAQPHPHLPVFTGHTSAIYATSFSPDGQDVLLAVGDEPVARLWDVDYNDTVRYLCPCLLREFTDEERAAYRIPNDKTTCPGRENR